MNGPADPLGWAKQPRSPQALAAVVRLAQSDPRFRAVLAGLVRQGVASEDQRLLRRWCGTEWQAVARR